MKYRSFSNLKQVSTTTGGVVKAFRNNFRFTQKELALVTGIAETNLSAIENDKIEIGVKRAVLIAAAFGIDPALILFPNGLESVYKKDIKAVQLASEKLIAKKKAS